MKILVCTDGSAGAEQTANLVVRLKFPTSADITVLGVSESSEDLEKLNSSAEKIGSIFRNNYSVVRKIRKGEPIEQILSEALENKYDLVVVGGGGKQMGLLQQNLGSTTSNLARKLHTHFLVARNVAENIDRILICASAEATSNQTMKLGGEWIAPADAKIGLLHVLQSTPEKSDTSSTRKTPEVADSDGVLIHAMHQLHAAGVKSNIEFRLRKGMVVQEVMSELAEGQYDLLVVGAHFQPGKDRWMGTLFDDITDQLLNRCSCSVLII